MAAISTIEDIRQRCVIDDITGCWNWSGSTSSRERCQWNPNAHFPPAGRSKSVGTIVCFLTKGRWPRKGHMMRHTCGNCLCVNPGHLVEAKRGGSKKGNPTRAASIAKTKRQQSAYSDEVIADVLNSNESNRACGERLGIGHTYVSKIRRGRARRRIGAPGSSVFNLGV